MAQNVHPESSIPPGPFTIKMTSGQKYYYNAGTKWIEVNRTEVAKIGQIACCLSLKKTDGSSTSDHTAALTTFHLLVNDLWLYKVGEYLKEHSEIGVPDHLDRLMVEAQPNDDYFKAFLEHVFNRRYEDIGQTDNQIKENMIWYLGILNKLLDDGEIGCSVYTRVKIDSSFEIRKIAVKSFLFGLPYPNYPDRTPANKYWPFDAVLAELQEKGGESLHESSKRALQYTINGYPNKYQISGYASFSRTMVRKTFRGDELKGRWIVKGGLAAPMNLAGYNETFNIDYLVEQRGYSFGIKEKGNDEYMQFCIQHEPSLINKGDSGSGIFIIDEPAIWPEPGRVKIMAMLTHVFTYAQGATNLNQSYCQPISRIISQFKKCYPDSIMELSVLNNIDSVTPSGESFNLSSN